MLLFMLMKYQVYERMEKDIVCLLEDIQHLKAMETFPITLKTIRPSRDTNHRRIWTNDTNMWILLWNKEKERRQREREGSVVEWVIPKTMLIIPISSSQKWCGTQIYQTFVQFFRYKIIFCIGTVTQSKNSKLHIFQRVTRKSTSQKELPKFLNNSKTQWITQ